MPKPAAPYPGPLPHAESARDLLVQAANLAADHLERRRGDPVAITADRDALAARIAAFDFAHPMPGADAVATLFDLLREAGVRSDHPRYFGLFNPPSLPAGIAGDIVAATVNPQLAVWAHAPAAAEIERHLVRLFGRRIWPESGETAGTFTSGGSEANHTALLAALARKCPDWADRGVAAFARPPLVYASAESHLAWIKIARAAGLGAQAVRLVPARDGLRLDGATLEAAIRADEGIGEPVLLVATAGTTAHGAIDDIAGIAEVGARHGAHVHVDAAWAGGILLDPAQRRLLSGIERADSVTIDPHKWLAVPMGAGLYCARDWQPLETAFGVSTAYMPSASTAMRDPYIHSLQWSRRFIGAKLFVALATLGVDGYTAMIERQFALGRRLRAKLAESGFVVVNDSPLPLSCFAPPGATDATVQELAHAVVANGSTWLSTVRLDGRLCLRACITGFETEKQDVDSLIDLLVTTERERRLANTPE